MTMQTLAATDLTLRLYATIGIVASIAVAAGMQARNESTIRIIVAFALGLLFWPAFLVFGALAHFIAWAAAATRFATNLLMLLVDL